jgi:hypothetical protein
MGCRFISVGGVGIGVGIGVGVVGVGRRQNKMTG